MSDFRPDIWRLQANFDTKGLITALHHEDAGVRRRAAAALRALGAIEATPALKTALDKEQDPDTRSNIVAALAALELERDRSTAETPPDPVQQSEFEQLIAELNTLESDKIIAASHKLGEMRDKRAVEPLVMLFNNLKIPVHVRLEIAEALLKLESAPVEVALLGALRSNKWKVRRNGAAILGQLRADWAVAPLIKALADENDTVRKTARAALKHINTPEARAALGSPEATNPHKTDTLTRARARAESPGVSLDGVSIASSAVTPTAVNGSVPAPAVTPAPSPSEPIESVPESAPALTPAPTAEPAAAQVIPAAVQPPLDPPSAPSTTAPAPAQVNPTQANPTPQAVPLGSDLPTQRQRPSAAADKLVWPKRDQAVEEDQSKIPTKPLDPKRLEEAEDRLNRIKPNDG